MIGQSTVFHAETFVFFAGSLILFIRWLKTMKDIKWKHIFLIQLWFTCFIDRVELQRLELKLL